MRGRTSRASAGAVSSAKPPSRNNAKRKRRNLDAFSIAEKQHGSKLRIRQHRLGEAENEEPQKKKQRLHGDDEDENEPHPSNARRLQQKSVKKGLSDDLDVTSGSDSEGHHWRLGEVDPGGDSEIDSDEAFGESDEDRFEGFTFRGSSQNGKRKSKALSGKQADTKHSVDLKEEADTEDQSEGDELGDDAIDLATALDQDEAESNDELPPSAPSLGRHSRNATDRHHDTNESMQDADDDSPSEHDFDDQGSSFSYSDNEDTGEDAIEQQKQLQQVVSSLPKAHGNDKEIEAPSNGQTSTTDLFAHALASLKESSNLDPAFAREVKKLSSSLSRSRGDKKSGLVQAPLPKRQQDKVDRKAAYGKVKETLNRWVDTVKHNRRSEHLVFPLPDPHAHEMHGTTKMLPTSQGYPRNGLEQTIQNILHESGLAEGANAEEKRIMEAEELEEKKMSLDEVLARRAELRKSRDLLFREEMRAKRIKKIKSKAYRRVHRKDAEKSARKERDLLVAAGIDLSEDEKEANDRQRAMERIEGRHRDSRWAKSIKQSGRTAWDKNAQDDVTEMARRHEDLRTRMEGNQVVGDEAEDSDSSEVSSRDSVDDNDEQSLTSRQRLLGRLEKIEQDDKNVPSSGLGSLKFMQKANAVRKQQNDREIGDLRRAVGGTDDDSEPASETEEAIGRRKFGPTAGPEQPPKPQKLRTEFEEPDASEIDSDDGGAAVDSNATLAKKRAPAATKPSIGKNQAHKAKIRLETPAKAKPYLEEASRARSAAVKSASKASLLVEADAALQHQETQSTLAPLVPNDQQIEYEHDDMEPEEELLLPSNQDLVRSAFGADDEEANFVAEKSQIVNSEDEKEVDNALPGWGSWTGEGISKRQEKRIQQKNRGRFTTVQHGIRPADRKDKSLDKVIISERGSKKNAKYLASTLPHPFESRLQYERTIRHPIGPEWTTKETFQNTTKPRLLIKPGSLIAPMETPTV